MSEKQFKYPPQLQMVKVLAKIIMVLAPLLLLIPLLSNQDLSAEEIRLNILSIIFAILICLLIIGSWCDVETDVDGLYVEFLGKKMFVPWNKIKGIKYIGFRPIGYWIILTNNSLTFFHRLYSVGTFPLLPSFHIHEELESRNTLLTIIKSRISQNAKNK
jgi:hypothetical protein